MKKAAARNNIHDWAVSCVPVSLVPSLGVSPPPRACLLQAESLLVPWEMGYCVGTLRHATAAHSQVAKGFPAGVSKLQDVGWKL